MNEQKAEHSVVVVYAWFEERRPLGENQNPASTRHEGNVRSEGACRLASMGATLPRQHLTIMTGEEQACVLCFGVWGIKGWTRQMWLLGVLVEFRHRAPHWQWVLVCQGEARA